MGQLVNQAELGRDVSLPQPIVHRWLNLLETSYLLVRLPAYAVNRTKRLIKAPKIYWGDTGIALHLAEIAEPPAHLENVVLQDLLAWRDARIERAESGYWRTAVGEEVDFLIEASGVNRSWRHGDGRRLSVQTPNHSPPPFSLSDTCR
jgi:predicted AAA+ superfamily ATPase